MPAKGKHRRSKTQRITRAAAVASAGGAALALPLIGATGAHAATGDAASTDAKTYTVKAGDTLSRIAEAQDVDGGWKKLYEANKSVVGSDAGLIQPGMKLTLDGAAKTASTTASSTGDSTGTGTADYVKPVDGSVGTAYHASGSSWSSGYHTGTDFVVSTGTTVKAVGDGTVVSAGWDGSYGNEVVIKHADGDYSQYAHLSSIGVSAGQTVTAGQQIGLSGATGNVTGPHLHFEIRTSPDYGSDIDPLTYLREHGVSI
ncbi:LysM peptidoglycan-binding domain-containing M23 family metallopeptidase [Streptomyces kunmingensis]|uniref:LysM peptidoglycan-binding domain-containing M23 family metallopeptidase n=1 Tax=Streptomyces kunmingensis TaxID=68225 RepID=A0ABU6CJ87_9ACTN|nr:LysM peptidoglycan-binding domain-containing M23 family metallopeptidase [Streptomyces kunmingensis]MEB3964758.1 LysM peptidoglycan-binding domain-containing M23 family metallopeptidase [Streptomyces kunmingensis]